MEPDPNSKPSSNKISPERQTTYYLGMGLCIVGGLLFALPFLTMPFMMAGHSPNPGSVMGPIMGAAFIGFFLLGIGSFVMNLGRSGLAGSGLKLDPEQMRDDLKPWNQARGGMVQDTISEIPAVAKLEEKLDHLGRPTQPQTVVKIRCRACEALNDENAKFCNQCGQAL